MIQAREGKWWLETEQLLTIPCKHCVQLWALWKQMVVTFMVSFMSISHRIPGIQLKKQAVLVLGARMLNLGEWCVLCPSHRAFPLCSSQLAFYSLNLTHFRLISASEQGSLMFLQPKMLLYTTGTHPHTVLSFSLLVPPSKRPFWSPIIGPVIIISSCAFFLPFVKLSLVIHLLVI